MARTAIALCLIAAPGAASAQTGAIQWQDRIDATIQSAAPTAGAPETQVRLPVLIDRIIPATQMPKALAAEKIAFFAKATAKAVIGADDQLSDCHTIKATIQRGSGHDRQPEAPVTADVCPLLASAHYRHALGVDGHPQPSLAEFSLIFMRLDKVVFAPPPIPAPPALGQTSGHVLSENGQWWLDSQWWANAMFVIAPPDWSAALTDRANLPQSANVGVMLKLTAKDDIGSIETCTIAMSSGHEKLDTATCNALKASSYTNFEGRAFRQTFNERDAYPVLVQWRGADATMTYPAMPTVPHLPHDVALTASDRPGATPPALHAIPIQITLDPAGHATGCQVSRTSGDDLWDAAGCRIALQRARLTSPVDGFGRPAKGIYQAVADWDAMTIHPAHL